MATLTGNSPQREAQLQSLMLDRLVLRYERKLMREIRRAMTQAAANPADLTSIISEHRNRLQTILTDLWMTTGRQFSEHILGVAAKSARLYKRNPFLISPTQIMDGVMRDWVRTYGLIKITQISETTRADIGVIIQSGIANGQTEREIGKMIRSVAITKSASRAATIARTETHAASQASAQYSAEATGLDMRRQWAASRGDRTRETHAEADGQIVGMNEPFIVGGYELMYPGDPNGPAEEVINCRCVAVYVI
jgi:uncharacterized protein with gpF-like domain